MARNGHPRVPRKIRGERRKNAALLKRGAYPVVNKPRVQGRPARTVTLPILHGMGPNYALTAWEKEIIRNLEKFEPVKDLTQR